MVSIESVGSENLRTARAFHQRGKKIQRPSPTRHSLFALPSPKKTPTEEGTKDLGQASEQNQKNRSQEDRIFKPPLSPHFQTGAHTLQISNSQFDG